MSTETSRRSMLFHEHGLRFVSKSTRTNVLGGVESRTDTFEKKGSLKNLLKIDGELHNEFVGVQARFNLNNAHAFVREDQGMVRTNWAIVKQQELSDAKITKS